MAIQLTDEQIAALVAETKPVPADFRARMTPKPKRGHKEAELQIRGVNGSEFRLIVRQSEQNPLDFSVVLGYRMPDSNRIFRLRRYNGKHGEHTNRLEGETFYECHVHVATERYQDSGFREDTFAEPTDRFSSLHDAVECLIEDCALQMPPDPQGRLFQ